MLKKESNTWQINLPKYGRPHICSVRSLEHNIKIQKTNLSKNKKLYTKLWTRTPKYIHMIEAKIYQAHSDTIVQTSNFTLNLIQTDNKAI